MIRSLYLENLKCFETLRLELAPLTLLTGFNAAGKSTSLQTLLLLAQTLRSQRGTAELRLNGPLTNLGTPADILNSGSGQKGLALGVGDDELEIRWQFTLDEENRRSLKVRELEVKGAGSTRLPASLLDGIAPAPSLGAVFGLAQALERTVMLSTTRQTETEVFPIPEGMVRRGDVGVMGQYAPWWLSSHDDKKKPVDPLRRHPALQEAATLRNQINAWMGGLFPGAEVNAFELPETNLMRLQLRSGLTAWSSPANIGFGVSYAFPVLVAGMAQGGHPLIIDSPEAHLHPHGQSQIGGFLAQMAAAGSQILVETHSDHFLNGVRLALRDGVIKPEDVAIYFFARKGGSPHVTRLSVDKHGTVSDWPEGFFDQSEKDLATLAGWT